MASFSSNNLDSNSNQNSIAISTSEPLRIPSDDSTTSSTIPSLHIDLDSSPTNSNSNSNNSGGSSSGSPFSSRNAGSNTSSPITTLTYISAKTAAELDEELMSPSPEGCGYVLPQLMELAGLACAQAVFKVYPPDSHPSALVACGPGNQGGDGLVAARHLKLWGYDVAVWYPKPGKKEFLQSLVSQLEAFDVPILQTADFEDAIGSADVMLDAIFGFSFKGPPREPFNEALEIMSAESRFEFEARRTRPPIVSVDIPSSWDVDEGNISNPSFTPEVLISLSAPKKGVRKFKGRHFIGGRFIPQTLDFKFGLGIPRYQGDSQIVEVTDFSKEKEKPIDGKSNRDDESKNGKISEKTQEEKNSLLMKELNIKGEDGMTEKEKEIIENLGDVETPKAD